METNRKMKTAKVMCLALTVALLAAWLPVLAAPGGITKPMQPVDANGGEILYSGIMYEDEYVKVEYYEAAQETQGNSMMSGMMSVGGAGMTVSTPTIVTGTASYLNVTLTGQNIPNGTATVYLDVNGQRISETAVVNNAARMHIVSPPAAGFYWLIAQGEDGEIARCQIEIIAYDSRIWKADIRPAGDGNTLMAFIEPISLMSNASVTVNGAAKVSAVSPDSLSLSVNYPYESLQEGDIIKATGVIYPRLFPSYYFTFTITYTKTVRHPLSVTSGDTYYLAASAFELAAPGSGEHSVSYDPEMLELMDAAAQTPEADIARGAVSGGGIEIKSHVNGVLVFTSTRPEEDFSGVLTLLKFRAKASGDTTVTIR